MDGRTLSLNAFVTLIIASVVSQVAIADDQVVRVRTAKVDQYMVAVSADQTLFGIDCGRGQLVFPTASGQLPLDTYALNNSTSNLAPVRTKSIDIEEGGLAALCEGPLNSQYLLVINDGRVGVIAESKGGQYKMADSAEARPYVVGDLIVAVTDRYRLVGFDCNQNKIVLQNQDGKLPMEGLKARRFAPLRMNQKTVTGDSLNRVCSRVKAIADLDLTLTGLRSSEVTVISMNNVGRSK